MDRAVLSFGCPALVLRWPCRVAAVGAHPSPCAAAGGHTQGDGRTVRGKDFLSSHKRTTSDALASVEGVHSCTLFIPPAP